MCGLCRVAFSTVHPHRLRLPVVWIPVSASPHQALRPEILQFDPCLKARASCAPVEDPDGDRRPQPTPTRRDPSIRPCRWRLPPAVVAARETVTPRRSARRPRRRWQHVATPRCSGHRGITLPLVALVRGSRWCLSPRCGRRRSDCDRWRVCRTPNHPITEAFGEMNPTVRVFTVANSLHRRRCSPAGQGDRRRVRPWPGRTRGLHYDGTGRAADVGTDS